MSDLSKARCHVVYNTGHHRLNRKKMSSHEVPHGDLMNTLASTALFRSTLILPSMPLGEFVSKDNASFDDLTSWIAQQSEETREGESPSLFFRPLRRLDALISYFEGDKINQAFWLLVDRGHDIRVLTETRAVKMVIESSDDKTAWVRLTDPWTPTLKSGKNKHTNP